MNLRLQKAFNAVGVQNPVQYVQETIDRIDKIQAALDKEEETAKMPLYGGIEPTLPQAKGSLSQSSDSTGITLNGTGNNEGGRGEQSWLPLISFGKPSLSVSCRFPKPLTFPMTGIDLRTRL